MSFELFVDLGWVGRASKRRSDYDLWLVERLSALG
jgi:hypothetical protein